MPSRPPDTAHAVSPDSGIHWSEAGAWKAAEGVHRIPLPLPDDGLRAVNVYVIERGDGLTLIDGGWSIEVARDLLERGLRDLGYRLRDIHSFLVTHVHRDHYTMASVLGREFGAEVSLGRAERQMIDRIRAEEMSLEAMFKDRLRVAGAHDLAAALPGREADIDLASWRYPDTWLESDEPISVGPRTLIAIHTPGHTPGHFVFVDAQDGLLFAGDHVLPTITPSIGFAEGEVSNPLSDFMTSLAKIRRLPDMRLLPAHGPVADSAHARIDELLAHHEDRLAAALVAVRAGATTAYEVAQQLPWTRSERLLPELSYFDRVLAVAETLAHLEVLVIRGLVVSSRVETTNTYVTDREQRPAE